MKLVLNGHIGRKSYKRWIGQVCVFRGNAFSWGLFKEGGCSDKTLDIKDRGYTYSYMQIDLFLKIS